MIIIFVFKEWLFVLKVFGIVNKMKSGDVLLDLVTWRSLVIFGREFEMSDRLRSELREEWEIRK